MLVAAPERWDEACFAIPALRALMASSLAIGLICREEQQEFWQTLPGLELITIPANAKAKHIAAKIKGFWQASLVWEAGFAAEVAKLADVRRRLGPDIPRLRKWITHPLVVAEKPLEHRVRFYLAAVEKMEISTLKADFFAPAKLGIKAEPNTVLLSPDSDFGPNHEWQIENWLKIAHELIEGGRRVTIAGMKGSRGLGETLATRLGKGFEYFEANPLSGTLPLLAVHELIIAADGSLPHLAAHAGATCVTLFGPNDPAWKRPLGKRHCIVRRHVECAPCLAGNCQFDMRCQKELETARVSTAVLEKLGKSFFPLKS